MHFIHTKLFFNLLEAHVKICFYQFTFDCFAHIHTHVCISKELILVLFELNTENAAQYLKLKQFSLTPAVNSFIITIGAVVDPIAELGQVDAFVGTNAADEIWAALEI